MITPTVAQAHPARTSDAPLVRPQIGFQTRTSLCLSPRPQTVIYVGKLSLEKGAHCLLAAAPIILTRAPYAHLLMVGDGVTRQPMEAFVAALSQGDLPLAYHAMCQAADISREAHFISYVTRFWRTVDLADYLARARLAGLQKRIVFTGYLPPREVAHHVSRATLSVIPSLVKEAFPLVSIEALASGVLPVAPAYGGLIPILDEIGRVLGPIGQLSRVRHDPDALTADLARRVPLLLSTLGRPGVRRRVAQRCRQLAVERYDWSAVIRQIEGLYQEARWN